MKLGDVLARSSWSATARDLGKLCRMGSGHVMNAGEAW